METALDVTMRHAGISKAQLSKRLGVDERKFVAPNVNAAILLGQRLAIGVESA
jgi:hypothetical protein